MQPGESTPRQVGSLDSSKGRKGVATLSVAVVLGVGVNLWVRTLCPASEGRRFKSWDW